MDSRIDSAVPRHIETSSYRDRPCRFEPCRIPDSRPGGRLLNAEPHAICPYRDYCTQSAFFLSRRLERAYGPRIRVSLAELSSSIVIRSEHQYGRMVQTPLGSRLALRKHIYEISPLANGDWRLAALHGWGIANFARMLE